MIPTLLGVALLAALLFDVFFTVFHPQGRGGPIHKRQNRGLWWIFRRVGGLLGSSSRERFLATAAPFLAVSTLLLWALLLIVAFALIYYPRVSSFVVTPGSVHWDWVGALYYSGYLASTLGLGDIAPNTAGMRLLTVVESVSGFALVSVSVAYLISVYREQGVTTTLAIGIHEYFRGRQEVLLRTEDPSQVDAIMRQMERFTDSLIHLLQAYSQYPILLFFRPAEGTGSLVVQLGHLFRLIEEVDSLGQEQTRGLGAHPSYEPLRRALSRYLDTVEEQLLGGEDSDARTRLGESEARHERLLSYMAYR